MQVVALSAAAKAVSAQCDGDLEAFGGGVARRRPATPATAAAGNNAAALAAAAADNAVATPIEVDGDGDGGEEGELEEGEAME